MIIKHPRNLAPAMVLIALALLSSLAIASISSVTLNAPANGFESRTGSGFNFSCNTTATDLINLTLFTNVSGTWQANASIRHGVFAIDVAEDVWDSADYGRTFTAVNTGFSGASTSDAVGAVTTSNDTILLLDGNNGVYGSTNLGVTWTTVNSDYNGAEGQAPAAFGIYPRTGVLMIAETDEDVWTSADNGTTWSKANTNFDGGSDTANAAGIAANSSGAFFIITANGKTYLSMNNGTNWSTLTTDYDGDNGNNPAGMVVTDNNTLVVLDTDSQVWNSANGANWTLVTSDFNPSDSNSGVTLTTDDFNLFATDASEDIYVSADFGKTFSRSIANLNGATGNVIALTTLRTVRGGPVNVQLNASLNGLPHGTYMWNCRAADNSSNIAFAAANRTFYSNISATLGNATASPNPIKGGNTITIAAVGPEDPDNQTLQLFCDEGGTTPNAGNTDCTGGTTSSGWPYTLNCTYTTTSDSALHQAHCRTFDGTYYSTVRTANFTTDVSPPTITNISWSPSTADQLDPNVTITVSANVTDATAGVDKFLLRSKQSNDSSWSTTTMTNTGGNLYTANFTPDVANTWTFRIEANDTFNITNATDTNLSIQLDGSWNVTPLIFSAVSGVISTNVSIGTLFINNTADFNHTFTVGSNYLNTFFNATTIAIPAGGVGAITVTATTSATVREDDVTLTISTTNSTAAHANLTSNFTLVSFVSGPYLYVTVSGAPANMVQGDSANITISVVNMGDTTANAVWLSWNLPTGWSITSASTNTTIGNLGVGNSDEDTFTLRAGSDAATGLNSITALAGSEEATGNKSISIVVTAPSTTNTETITLGGGAAGGAPAPAPTLSATAPANAAVQIGTEEGFPVKVTNTFDDSLSNIRLEVSGFLSQYISIEPATIALLKPGEVGQFIVKIKAPDYLSDQNFQLNITVHADRVTARGTTELTKSLTTGLLLLAVAPEQVSNSLTGAEQAIRDVEAAGLNAQKLQQLLTNAQSAIAAKNYADADRLVKEIMRLKDVALGATAQLKTMEEKIAAVHAEGLSIPETERVVQLAKEAMARGDFDRAAARLGSASLTLALETKGQVNVIALSIHWWWLIALGSLVTAMGAATAWRELTLWRIGRGLSNMRREERSINELMGQTQTAYYHGQSIPKVDFYKTMYQYEKRLAEVHADFSRLVTQRAKLINATDEANRLDNEDAKLKRLIIELQKKYFEEGRMGKAAYERQMHELVRRRSELAEQHELVMKQGRQKMSRVVRLAERTKGLYNRAAAAADRWVRGI